MKRAILGMMALVFATASMAQTAPVVKAKAETWQEKCTAFSSLAETVMNARQSGVSMSDAVKVAGENPIVEKMVIDAYEKPRYSTEKMQKREAQEFRDTWFLGCSQALRPK